MIGLIGLVKQLRRSDPPGQAEQQAQPHAVFLDRPLLPWCPKGPRAPVNEILRYWGKNWLVTYYSMQLGALRFRRKGDTQKSHGMRGVLYLQLQTLEHV